MELVSKGRVGIRTTKLDNKMEEHAPIGHGPTGLLNIPDANGVYYKPSVHPSLQTYSNTYKPPLKKSSRMKKAPSKLSKRTSLSEASSRRSTLQASPAKDYDYYYDYLDDNVEERIQNVRNNKAIFR